MQKVAEFEKVSLEQFIKAIKDEFGDAPFGYTVDTDKRLKEMWEEIKLPQRATSGSAGYDFYAPFAFRLYGGDNIKIPTGIRVKIDNGWWLGCMPRSGLGFKYKMRLANTIGVIDSDYYHSDNEGHIMLKLSADGIVGTTKVVTVGKGDAFAQGIFIPFGITYSDNAEATRNGGFGSTDGKKEAG